MMASTNEYKFHYDKGKRLFKKGDIENSVKELKIAFKISPNEDLQCKINKIEELISKEQTEFKPDEKRVLINEAYCLNAQMFDKLYKYQQEGVIWMFNLFKLKKGCILADDMGLGKTIQMIFYLRELFVSEMIKSALIIIPKSLLVNWERELKAWAPNLLLLPYFGSDKEEKWRNLKKIQHKGGILITTYGTVIHNWNDLNSGEDFKWNILLLDEGHKIKNPSSQTFKTVNALRADIRIVITGTAVQNNLKELWALFDFTHQGSLLGTYPTFNRGYEKPITDSRKKDASQEEKSYGDRISMSLKNLIKPFFLRRTKEQVIDQINAAAGKLSEKTDFAVWIPMTDVQIDFYKKFLEFEEVKILLLRTEKRSPLLELNVLKKICDHPRLLSPEQCKTLGLEYAESIKDIEINDLIAESGKMTFIIQLIKQMMKDNCKCLIFSQSKVILTILGRLLLSMKVKHLRLDGDVLKAEDRQTIVDNFNNNSEVKFLLLTLQVGGVGLTLTGADRVIIYDLNWNPSVDAQAVDRIYRIGQKKAVIIYRLITCGTVEEKIYRRQIFKDSLNRQTTGIKETDDNTCRYFTQSELFELFTMGNPLVSDTQIQLNQKHSRQPIDNEYLIDHLDWLKNQRIFGISNHDLLFSEKDEDINIESEIEQKLIANLKETEQILNKEAQSQMNEEEQNLRFLMSRMAITEKPKTKEKIQVSELFIPSTKDIKRLVLNQTNKSIFQTKLDDYIAPKKENEAIDTFIDLTSDTDKWARGKMGDEFSHLNSIAINNLSNSEEKENNYRRNYPAMEHGTNENDYLSNNNNSGTKSETDQSNDSKSNTISISDSDSNSGDLETEIESGRIAQAPKMKLLDSSDENIDSKDYDIIEHGNNGECSRLTIEDSEDEYSDSSAIAESSGAESESSQSNDNKSNVIIDSRRNDSEGNSSDMEAEIKNGRIGQAPKMKILDSSEEDIDSKDFDDCETEAELEKNGENSRSTIEESDNEYSDSSSNGESSGTKSEMNQSNDYYKENVGTEQIHLSNENLESNESFNESQDLLDETI